MKKATANLIPRLRLDPSKFGANMSASGFAGKTSGHVIPNDMIIEDSLMEDQMTPYNNSTVRNLMEKSISGAGLSITGSKKSISHRSEKEAIALTVMNLPPPKHSTTTADLVNYMDEYEPQRTDLDVSKVMVLA